MNKTAIFALILMRGKISLISNHSAKLNFETLGKLIAAMFHLFETLGKLIAAMFHLPVKDK